VNNTESVSRLFKNRLDSAVLKKENTKEHRIYNYGYDVCMRVMMIDAI
jgi:hypothetical protein